MTLDDGSAPVVYENVPNEITPDLIEARVSGQFPMRKIVSIDGGAGKTSAFLETPGGAVTGIQRQLPTLSSATEAASNIAGAGTIGGIMGAAAP